MASSDTRRRAMRARSLDRFVVDFLLVPGIGGTQMCHVGWAVAANKLVAYAKSPDQCASGLTMPGDVWCVDTMAELLLPAVGESGNSASDSR